MTTFTKRALYIAIASIGTLATTGVQAVNVSPDGRGQVLLYPYYTTRADSAGNPYGTLLSVINATGSAKAVRVRFLEGKNSREVLDFNLFLSPFDVWTAAVLPDDVTGGAKIGTTDLSCTLPAFSASPTAPFVSFANASYSGANYDGAGAGLDRTKEGYFEIIEMATYAASSPTGASITHLNGVPACHPFIPPFGGPVNDARAAVDALPPNGDLFGSLTLINVNSGTDYTADAVALANFYQSGSNYQSPGMSLPDLTQATPAVSAIQAPNGMLYESTWTTGTPDAVSAVLMHDSMMNEYVLDSATKSGTDWVVTMPTKRYYVNPGTGNAPKLFQRNFNGSAGSCDDHSVSIVDREERGSFYNACGVNGCPPNYCGFNECPIPPKYALCSAANVITFSNGNVLGSQNLANITVPFQNGWLSMGFPTEITGAAGNVHTLINSGATSISGTSRTATGNSVTYVGLPMVGFAVASFTNGTLVVGAPPVNVLSNYGGNFVHKTSTTIQ